MTQKFALICSTLCQGLVVADGDMYDTRELAQKELDYLRQERDQPRFDDGEEPEGEDDDFFIDAVRQDGQGQWYINETGETVTLMDDE